MQKADLNVLDKNQSQITLFQKDNNSALLLSLEYLKTAHKKDTMSSEKIVKENTVNLNGFSIEDVGDDHLFTGLKTPMKA